MNERKTSVDRMSEEMEAAFRAVDALSSWVRAETRFGKYPPKHAIYEMKRQAILRAHEAGHLGALDWVAVAMSCRHCSGTGTYRDYDGYDRGPCYRCRRGTVILYFMESAISLYTDGSFVLARWHTPSDLWPSRQIPPPNRLPSQTAWEPNQPGKDMEPGYAAECLCLVESYFPHRPGPRYQTNGPPVDDFAYSLWVGANDPAICSLCQGPVAGEDQRPRGGYLCHRNRIRWNDHACRACVERYDREDLEEHGDHTHRASIFDAFPTPTALVADPRIQMWMEKHPVPQSKKQEAPVS